MANYLHRLVALEDRLGAHRCGRHLCAKCVIAQLGGGKWTGCDQRPMTITELLTDVDDQLRSEQPDPA